MALEPIPFNHASYEGKEQDYMSDAFARGDIGGDGAYTKRAERLLESLTGSPRVLLTTSCTHALEMSALLLNIQPGDEVILPSYTFVSTANAFVLRGAKPVFADIRPDTLNIDETKIEALITARTRAICVVHYAGVGCEMDTIMQIAEAHGLAVVEDNAHGILGSYRGRPLGSIGSLATLSFHETKNITCGEGGALIINDEKLIARAEIIREKGTNRSQFVRGQVDKYTWVDVGSSYVLSDLLAGLLYGQLEARERIRAKRQAIWQRYDAALCAWAGQQGVGTPHVPAECEQSYHMFYLILPTSAARDRLIGRLRELGISAYFHYIPLHLSVMGANYGYREGDLPVTESLSERLVRLPFFNRLQPAQQQRVIEAIISEDM